MTNENNLEIERKYLLNALPELNQGTKFVYINQGYIPGTKIIERVRSVTTYETKTTTTLHYRTIKIGNGLVRTEIEEECSADIFEHLWKLTNGKQIRKTRYLVPDGGHIWEIDHFHDHERELFLAEIELTSEDEVVVIPSWLQPYIVREVTEESEYTNYKLSK